MLQCSGAPPPCRRCASWARRGRALLGGGFPSSFPSSAAARVKRARLFGGGGLSAVSPPSGFCAGLARWGFSSPSSALVRPALCSVAPWPSSLVAGPALAWPLSDASKAILLYSWCGCLPFSVVAPSASSKCSVGFPALPSPAAVSVALVGVAVRPLRSAPSPPLGPCPLVARVVGGFSSPPPRPHPSSPCQYWDAVRDPRVSSPLVPSASLGVELS